MFREYRGQFMRFLGLVSNTYLSLAVTIIGISASNLSIAGILPCPKQNVQDKCGSCEPKIVKTVLAFVNEIQSGARKIEGGDEFLNQLFAIAPVMFDNYIIMEASASAQKSTPGHPRILLKSPDSEVLIGYATDPDAAGYERMEVVLWNATTAQWEYREVHFPKDLPFSQRIDQVTRKTWDPNTRVTLNPVSCKECHSKFGGDLKPNWDAYYFWAGQLPFRQDLILKGSKEEQRYVDFYRGRRGYDPRLIHLRVPGDVTDFLDSGNWENNYSETAGSSRYTAHRIDHLGGQLYSQDNRGPGTRMFNQLSGLNYCRITNQVQEAQAQGKPLYPKVKYAVAAVIEKCSNFEAFFPNWYVKKASDFFSKSTQMVQGAPAPKIAGDDIQSLFGSLLTNTKMRQNSHFTEKLQRQQDFLTGLFGSGSEAQAELGYFTSAIGIHDRENSTDSVSRFRFTLEPWGMDLKRWSLSNNPDTYTFGDMMGDQLPRIPLINDIRKEWSDEGSGGDFCAWMQEKSLAALGETPPESPVDSDPGNSTETPIFTISRDDLAKYRVPQSCIACHEAHPKTTLDRSKLPFIIPGPEIKFDDVDAFRDALKDPAKGSLLKNKLIDRTSRAKDQPGRMPFPPYEALTKKEQATFKAYLEFLAE